MLNSSGCPGPQWLRVYKTFQKWFDKPVLSLAEGLTTHGLGHFSVHSELVEGPLI